MKKFSSVRGAALCGAATWMLAWCSSAWAQTAESNMIEGGEIVVTATKRAESLQDVPISVSVVGGDACSARGSPTSMIW